MESDPTKLTSFKPLTPVTQSSRFSFSRWLDGITKRKTSQVPNLPPTREHGGHKPKENVRHSTIATGGNEDKKEGAEREDFNSWLTKSITSQSKLFGAKEKVPEVRLTPVEPRKEKWRYRNVRTILRRLSALTIDKRWHQTTGDFKDDFKQYWMPDEHCKECYECGDKFNTFRRRHHCRVCGQIFCYKCCNQEVHGKIIGFSGDIRVCNYCHKIVQAYLNDDLENSIDALQEDIKAVEQGYRYEFNASSGSLTQSRSGKHLDDSSYRMKRSHSANSITSAVSERANTPTVQRSPFDMFGVDPSEANSIKQNYLRDLWRRIIDPRIGIELQSHRFRMKMYHNCLVGNELTDWLIQHHKANTRPDAVGLGQDLLDYGWIECVYPAEPVFLDEYMLYQPTKVALVEMEEAKYISSDEESTVSGIETNFGKNENTPNPLQEDDDDPNWLKQISNGTKTSEDDGNPVENTMPNSQFRKFSTGRRLDLDHVTADNADTKKADLSLQMNLDSQKDNEKKEIYDQTNKVSFITHVPPLPLDTYVCVDGYQSSVKKKIPKQNSTSNMSEDILKGVVFPRSTVGEEIQVEDSREESTQSESRENISHERTNNASRYHITRLFDQLLVQENLSKSWNKVVLPFIIKVSEKVFPDARRDDMDIRRYVWITKVPGGLKTDCLFVSGVVFRKNVAHKRMSGTFTSPSILMMSCAIEYQRVENKMSSLDPLVLQEYAFLQNFVKRVLALKPNVILVEKNVARVAQDMLLAGGVTLVHNIKPNMMENIARCTGADILQTMEQVTRPRLGKCQQFRLQKFTLPNGKHKVLMVIDGCAPDLGCSLILRGGNEKTLIKIKKIVKYLIYVAYQLKLEAKFLADEFALPPPLSDLSLNEKKPILERSKQINEGTGSAEGQSGEYEVFIGNKVVEEETEPVKFQEVLKKILLSSSPFCNYTLPFLLSEEGKLCASRHFIADRIYWSRYLDGSVNNPKQLPEDDHEWVENENHVNSAVILNDPHPFTNPSLLLDCIQNGNGNTMGTILNDFRARGGCVDLKMFRDYDKRQKLRVYGGYLTEESGDEREYAEGRIDSDMKETGGDSDLTKDAKLDCFDAFNHQKIAVLFSSYSSESKNAPKPCISPWAVFMEFYGRNDITLGGFLERYCFRPSYICPSHNCDVPMVNHVRYFAHGNGSLYIHMRNLESPIPGYDRTMLTWSWCKICKQVTPVVPLSFESWAMSFAKYLELRFYGVDYKRRASVEPCNHSLHHDHYQYFSYANMVASFKYRAIDLYEVIIPSSKIVIGEKRNPKYVLDDFSDLCKKVEHVNQEIRERLNQLTKTEDQFNSAVRDAKIKEFIADLEREESNTQNVIHVIKLKTENFAKSLSDEDVSEMNTTTVTVESNLESHQPKGLDVVENSKSGWSSLKNQFAIDGPCDKSPVVQPAGATQLTDEEVRLLWMDIARKVFHLKKNICETVEDWNHKLQDFVTQDRKREKAGINNSKPPPTEIVEYNSETTAEPDPPQPKTVTHMHPEPVSEVFLTDGTILRQTHYGTTPRDSSPMNEQSGEASPAKSRKTSSGSQNRKSSFNSSTEKKDLLLKVEESKVEEESQKTVARSSSIIIKSSDATDSSNLSSSAVVQRDDELKVELDFDQEDSDLFRESKFGSIRSSDRGTTDTASLFGEDDESLFPDGSGSNSCVESAEEEEDTTAGHRSVQEPPKVPAPTKILGSSVSKTAGIFREYSRIREEKVERIEYLTPKEVKAMQVARRRRNEWESKIKAAQAMNAPSPVKAIEEPPIDISENHFDDQGAVVKPSAPPPTGKKSTAKHLRNQILKRIAKNNFESSGEDASHGKNKNKNAGDAGKKGKKVPVKQVDRKKSLENPSSSFKPVKIQQDIPDHEHPLYMDANDHLSSSPDLLRRDYIYTKKEPATIGPDFNRAKRMGHRRMKSAPLRMPSYEETDASSEVPSELPAEGPFVYVNPASPVQDEGRGRSLTTVSRSRSHSLGTRSKYKGQKELSRLAELVVQEDRRDIERDVQIDHNAIKSASAGQIETSSTLSNDMNLDGKRTSNDDDGKKISDVTSLVRKSKLGHTRHKSLSSRFLNSIDGDTVDGSKLTAVAVEGPSKGRGGSEKMKKIISHILSNTTFHPILRPFPPSQQYLPQVGGTASIVINELEPTSLIAFTLSSRDYSVQLTNIQDITGNKGNRSNLQTPTPFASQPNSPNPLRKKLDIPFKPNMPTSNEVDSLGKTIWVDTADGSVTTTDINFLEKSHSPAPTPEPPALRSVGRKHPLSSCDYGNEGELDIDDSASTDEVLEESLKLLAVDDVKKKEDKASVDQQHIKLQFQNDVAKFYCSVYFAEQFRQLREKIFPEGEERFVQSLSRCKFWKATGGKSGSSFSKSYDDRFVMKQMSRLEVQSFVDFGPRYFSYINKAIKEDRPTALAKLLGVYRIGFKNSVTNATMRQDVLVMENLFFEKKVNKIFDLKGSLRGRKVPQANKEDVLLDENLLEMICDSPLFIRGHSKAILSKAIHNDTEFLSTNMVMDYSLLVGIDEVGMKLVVGIIDYIRTYTWDKKLESYVKSTGILGGAGKMPTVVSPDLYRTRFTEAMQRYFLMVPDKWTGFGNDLT